MEEDVIRRYFNNELSDSERVEVELRQLEDSEFASLMIQFESTRDGIRLAKKESLKNRLKEIESQKKPKGRFKLIAIAASIALVFGVGGMLIWNQTSNSPENLYAEYYEPYPNIHSPITRDADSVSPLEQAFVDYELGEYAKAIKGFDVEIAKSKDQNVLFYKAIALIQLEKTKEAQSILASIEKEQSDYRPQIVWYQGLLYLKNEELEKAKKAFNELDALKSGYKTQKVKEILKKL